MMRPRPGQYGSMMMPFSEMPACECEGMNMKDANLKDRVMHARLTKGAARYGGAFTPPTGPYPTS